MRSPSVERFIWSNSAARDLFPPLTLKAHPIRSASRARTRSSSEVGTSCCGTADVGTDTTVGGESRSPGPGTDREMPPRDSEAIGDHTIEATSRRLPGTLTHRHDLWTRCYQELMERACTRLEQEIARLGGDDAHVLTEEIEPRHDDRTGEAWMYGRFDYELYRHASRPVSRPRRDPLHPARSIACDASRDHVRRASDQPRRKTAVSLRARWMLAFLIGIPVLCDRVWAQPNSAQTELPRVELWGAATAATTGPTVVLSTAYSPPLLFDGGYTSHGGQTLTGHSAFGFGFAGGMNVFPSTHVGFQVLLDRASSAIAGTNTPYAISLEYISIQPPNDLPQPVVLTRSFDWPDTSGTLTRTAIGFDAALRFGRPDRVAVTASAGPALYRLGGSVQPVGFTTFHLGGHSVLFEDDHRLAMSLDSTNVVGFNAGVEFSAAIGGRTAIVVGYRYFGAPDQDAAVTPSGILNSDQVSLAETLDEIASQFGAHQMTVSISGSRIMLGMKVMLK
jgi:hypothetical protein